ncbi:MAG TPA: class II aldolase/adducin family protein [Acidimicrobiales bacterium]|nr:class II aldolase/adducin family protein [Acidimicrobiales bacterium]
MLSHASARQSLVEAWTALALSGVMSPSGHGNFSSRLGPQQLLLTGSGMSAQPHADDLAVVHLDGVVEEGEVRASVAEIVGMHSAVYRARDDTGAVVHTHSPAVTAFALAHEPLPCRYEALLRHGQAGSVPVVAWAPRGSGELVEGITRTLEDHPETPALLLANHGVLAFAKSPGRATDLVIALEEAARAELAAASLGGSKAFPPRALQQVQASMRRSGQGDGQGRAWS